jgi:preprotein translocase subunit SecG
MFQPRALSYMTAVLLCVWCVQLAAMMSRMMPVNNCCDVEITCLTRCTVLVALLFLLCAAGSDDESDDDDEQDEEVEEDPYQLPVGHEVSSAALQQHIAHTKV